MKKVMSIYAAILAFVAPTIVQAATLPEEVDGKITLNEDLILDEKYVVTTGETLTIDLAGHTLTGPSDNYAIDNQGTLTIIDSGITKGSIECPADSSSCIRNLGNLTVDGVSINTAFVALKNEEDAIMNVKDSRLESSFILPTGYVTGTINNAGTLTIDNSEIIATTSSYAIYATSGATEEQKNSNTFINSSILEGKQAVYARRSDSATTDTTQTIVINGGEIKGTLTATAAKGSSLSVIGDVKVSGTYLSNTLGFAKEGANITLTTDLSKKSITVPEGVKLIIPEGVTYTISSTYKLSVQGSLEVQGTLDAAALVTDTNEYFGTLARAVLLIGEGTNIQVLKDLTESSNIQPYADKTMTIDLNGYTVNGNIIVRDTDVITIKDSSENETGTLVGTITNNGTLTIESGIFTEVPVTAEGAITTLNGGTYPLENIENANIPEDRQIIANADGTYSIVYIDADYSAVNEAIAKAQSINRDNYTTDSLAVLDGALNNVVFGKKINEQEVVDAMANEINTAIAELQEKSLANTPDPDIIESPKTGDKIIVYITLGVISVCGIGYLIKTKKIN